MKDVVRWMACDRARSISDHAAPIQLILVFPIDDATTLLVCLAMERIHTNCLLCRIELFWSGNCNQQVFGQSTSRLKRVTKRPRIHAMQIKSRFSLVGRSKNSKNKCSEIRNSWSDEEVEKRRKTAIEMQLRLVALISMQQQQPYRSRDVFELAS